MGPRDQKGSMMPYIKPDRRMAITETAGELNYALTTRILEYLDTQGESYQTYCEIAGVLSNIGDELYRRRVAAYEDRKIIENGDVYT